MIKRAPSHSGYNATCRPSVVAGISLFPRTIGDQNKGRDYANRGRCERGEEQQEDVADDEEVDQADQVVAVPIRGAEPKSTSGRFEFPPVMCLSG